MTIKKMVVVFLVFVGVFLVFGGLLLSCGINEYVKYVHYYRVTIKTSDGIILYEEEKPDLRVYVSKGFKVQVYILGSDPHFEIFGNDLMITWEASKKIAK
jgi:hypothetical protein